MTDCMIVGFNDGNFPDYVRSVKAMGLDSGAFRDLRLATVNIENTPLRALDVLNYYHADQKTKSPKRFSNADFLWPVITVLGSYLAKNGISFGFVNLFQDNKDTLRDALVTGEVLTVAITTTVYIVPDPIIEIVKFVRRYAPRTKIIVGGPFVASRSAELGFNDRHGIYRLIDADVYVTSNEGEAALVKTIRAMKANDSLGDIPNLVYRHDGKYVGTHAEPEENPLPDNPPNYSLFPSTSIGEFVSTRTAKSCPFSCAFCGFPERAGKYKYLGLEHVKRELDSIKAIGSVSTVTFLDDTFNVPARRFKDILRLMIDQDYGFRWNSFYRSDHGDEEAIELMAKAGCEGVFLGAESGSDAILKLMNKTSRRADYTAAIQKFREVGISTYASLIVGFPGETRETVEETIRFIEDAKPDFYRAQLWYCDPVTPIWQRRSELGIRGQGFSWSHATMNVREACQIIDELFLSVRGSLWLPQWGFEQWSIFYLRRRGFSMRQIVDFVTAFNAAIKMQLVKGGESPIPDDIRGALKRTSRLEPGASIETTGIERYSADRYRSASEYWERAFATPARTDQEAHSSEETVTTEDSRWATTDVQSCLATSIPNDLSGHVALALFARALGREQSLTEMPILALLAGMGLEQVIPMSVSTEGDIRRVSERCLTEIESSRPHQAFASYLLTKSLRLREGRNMRFPFAFCELEKGERLGELDSKCAGYRPTVKIALLYRGAPARELSLCYRGGGASGFSLERLKSAIVEEFRQHLATNPSAGVH